MTDSIKAQLHLSLDRLSETSFDAGANDVAKVRSAENFASFSRNSEYGMHIFAHSSACILMVILDD